MALIASALLPAVRAEALGFYDALFDFAEHWMVSRLPAAMHPVAKGFLAFILSPLVYVILALVFLAEKYVPAEHHDSVVSRGMIQDFFAWFMLDSPLKGIVNATSLALLYLLLENYFFAIRLSDQSASLVPAWVRVVAALLLIDLLSWIHHYLHHKVKFLWFFHSVHHSQRQLNLFTDFRFHAFEYVTLAPIIYAPLFFLNLNFQLAAWIVLFKSWYPQIYHANLRVNLGPLRYLLVTPQSHRVHHSRLPQHIDKNFAALFSFWDRLFGTQWTNYMEYPATGIEEEFPCEESVAGIHVLSNYFAQLVHPFQCVWKALSRKSAG